MFSIICLLFSIQTNTLHADTEVIGNLTKISEQREISLKINPVEPQVGICNFIINIFDIENQKYITSAKVEIFVTNNIIAPISIANVDVSPTDPGIKP